LRFKCESVFFFSKSNIGLRPAGTTFLEVDMEKRKSVRQQQDLFAPEPERPYWADLPVACREKTQNLLTQLLSNVLETYNIETPIQENHRAVENNV
jgi:hypothetical protein